MTDPEIVRDVNSQVHTIYADDEREFMLAMQKYKTENRRVWPTWHEVLAVVRSLGYRRVAEPGPLPVFNKHANGYTSGNIAASGS